MVLSVLVALGIIIALFSRRSSPPSHLLQEDGLSQRRPFTPLASQELSNDLWAEMHKDFRHNSFRCSSFRDCDSLDAVLVQTLSHQTLLIRLFFVNYCKSLQISSSFGLQPPSDHIKSANDNGLANYLNVKRSSSVCVTCYSLTELQTSTGNFATGRLLGEGSLWQVYRAKYADGKVLVVKKIDSSLFQGDQRIDFIEIVSNISKLHHPNIAEIVGYFIQNKDRTCSCMSISGTVHFMNSFTCQMTSVSRFHGTPESKLY